MGKEGLRIRTFGDAVSAVFGLHDRFGHAHTAVALDEDGLVLDLTAFTGAEHEMRTALHWANCLVVNAERLCRLVLLSTTRCDARTLREEDIRFERARASFARDGVEVLDWILFDGEWTRSLAFSLGLASWGPDGLPASRPREPA